jgi:hypothetical protein
MWEKLVKFCSSKNFGWICTGVATLGALFYGLHCYTIASFVWLFSNVGFVIYNVKQEKPLWAQALFFVLNSVLCLVQLFC